MKTSFYFVLWIAIYPILSLLPLEGIREYSFLVALLVVFGVSWLLRRTMMPTVLYDSASRVGSLLEDLYNGNTVSFRRRINREAAIESVSAAYFAVTTAILIYVVIRAGTAELFALIIFAFLAVGAFGSAAKLFKARAELNRDGSPERCITIAEEVYGINYTSYYEHRQTAPVAAILPPRPKYFTLYLVISLVTACVCVIAGAAYAVIGAITIAGGEGLTIAGFGLVNILYGTLALYFGLRDIITIVRQLRSHT